MKQSLTARVVFGVLLLSLSDKVSAVFDKNCYKTLSTFGEPVLDTDVLKTDLDKIKGLADPSEYRFG
jgi:hypothetical protein